MSMILIMEFLAGRCGCNFSPCCRDQFNAPGHMRWHVMLPERGPAIAPDLSDCSHQY